MKIPLNDDSQLIESCIQKDLAAWSVFVKKYSGLIHTAINTRLKKYGISASRADIEDIRQNILGIIWQDNKLATIENRRNIAYWLAIVSGNEAIAYARRKRMQAPPSSVSLDQKIDDRDLADIIPSGSSGPSGQIAKDELAKHVDEAIASLPDTEKLIIKLSFFHDKKNSEIAALLKLPQGTVSSYIKRAKERLQARLKDFR